MDEPACSDESSIGQLSAAFQVVASQGMFHDDLLYVAHFVNDLK